LVLVALGAFASGVWAQGEPVRNWAAPLYWQPSAQAAAVTGRAVAERLGTLGMTPETTSGTATAPLVFVAVTPCRMMDTRGYDSTFVSGTVYGPPAMTAGSTRTVPVAGVTAGYCSLPATAQAVSLNVTLWPTPGTQVQWITLWPAGQTQPSVSTLNDYQGTMYNAANGITMYGINNAAIVPLGTGGAFDIYVTNATNLFIDVNGYYLAPSSLALGAGTAAAPSLTFSNDTNTGLYSSAAGTLEMTSSGSNILTVNSNGISVNGVINNNACTAGWCIQTPTAEAITGTAGFTALLGQSTGTGSTIGVEGEVASTTGIGGEFFNNAATGDAIAAYVNGTQIMTADQNGVHAGPGLTGTPFAYGAFDSSANKLAGSGNISCFLESTWYGCELFSGGTQISYDPTKYVVVVTELATTYNAYPRVASVFLDNMYNPNRIGIYFYGISGTSSVTVTDGVTTDFSIAVYKP
jgi:hypothetical protein